MGEKHSAALSKQESLANAKSYIEKNGTNLTMNQTDALLQSVGDVKFSYLPDAASRKHAAAEFERNNPMAFAKMAAPMLADVYTKNFATASIDKPAFEKNYKADASAITNKYQAESDQFKQTARSEIADRARGHGLSDHGKSELHQEAQNRKAKVESKVAENITPMNKESLETLKQKHESRKEKSTLRRAAIGDYEAPEMRSMQERIQEMPKAKAHRAAMRQKRLDDLELRNAAFKDEQMPIVPANKIKAE